MSENIVLVVAKHQLQGNNIVNTNTVTCDKCGVEYGIGVNPFCPHAGLGSALASKQYPFVTRNFNGQEIEVTSASHEKALMQQYGVVKRDDAAFTEKQYLGYDYRTGKQVYKEGNGVGLPGCWI